MATYASPRLRRRSTTRPSSARLVPVLALAAALVACGGGGSDPSLSISTHEVAVAAAVGEPAPTATVEVSLADRPSGDVYIDVRYTDNGIAGVDFTPTSGTTGTVWIFFRGPETLTPGRYDDTLLIGVCLDEACGRHVTNSPQEVAVSYTVTGPPLLVTGLSPSSAVAGGPGLTLTVLGTGFSPGCAVRWNGADRPTTYLTPTQLSAELGAADLGTAGPATVTVAAPGGEVSNGLEFVVEPPPPLVLTALHPWSAVAGGAAFTLQALGAGFTVASEVTWDGAPLPTTWVSSTVLEAAVPAGAIAGLGTASIAVRNPAEISAALTFTIGDGGPIPPPPGLWAPAPGTTPASGSYVYLESDPGDYIGGGQVLTYTPANATLTFTGSAGYVGVAIGGGAWWNGDFQAMASLPLLVPGFYGDLARYPFHDPARGGLSWSGEGRGCNTLTGWFVVDAVSHAGGALTAVDLRFEQHCEGGPPALHGQLHWAGP